MKREQKAMKVRTRISLLIFAFLVVTVGLVFAQMPVGTTTAIASPLPASTETPTATATETPTLSGIINQTEKSVFDPILAALNFAAALLITALVFFLIRRIWLLSHTRNLIIDTFKNSTGDDELDKVLPGLSQLTREGLVGELERVRIKIEYYKNLKPDPNRPIANFPAPEGTSDEQLTNLLKSLQDTTTGEVKTAAQIMNLVFLSHGTKVVAHLQSQGDLPATLGISFEVTDLRGQQEPTLYTVWEQTNADLDRQQAQAYHELGVLLNKVGLFEDAIRYLEEALKRDPKCDEVAKALVASASHLQVQRAATWIYAIGKQLQDANLLPAAIESYKKALSIADQVDAEMAWKIVLKPTIGDAASAYLLLARLYRKETAYLFDQSLELYKAAVAQGSVNKASVQASKELGTIQQIDATRLTQVGQLLYELAQCKAAEKYLMLALAKVPNDTQAQTALAVVKQGKHQRKTRMLWHHTLGKLYEARGAVDQAKDLYEDALKKQPSFIDAKDALESLFQNRQTLEQRYLKLLEPAVRWLALELARRTMAVHEPNIFFKKRKRDSYRAKLYNFIGSFHLSSAQTYRTFPFFYDLAVADFSRAKKLAQNWYQPYRNLANVYKEKGKKGRDELSEDSQRQSLFYYHEALKNYTDALELLDNYVPYLSIKTPAEKQKIKRRICVEKAIAQLLTDKPNRISEAKGEIVSLDKERPFSVELDGHLLYNVAVWYALLTDSPNIKAAGVTATDAKNIACRYLAYGLARDEMLWSGVREDPDLESIKDRLEDLLFTLKQKLQELPNLARWTNEPGKSFEDAIKDVLEEANSLSQKGDRKP